MISILFVCLGNICRSPMAEALMRAKVKEAGLEEYITVDSAGTGNYHIGKPPHEGTRQILDQNMISYEGMQCRQFHEDDFTSQSYIVCMDENNERDIMSWNKANLKQSVVLKLMDLLPEEHGANVPDPYYTGDFEEVYRLVDAGCNALLAQVKETHKHLLP